MKKGCLRASRAVSLSDGSNRRSPCTIFINSPAEWSTCCIIRFCKTQNIVTKHFTKIKLKIPTLDGPEAEEVSALLSGYLLRLPHQANPNDLFSHISLRAGFITQPKKQKLIPVKHPNHYIYNHFRACLI